MNDPNYSDLFNQCMNTGGYKPSPIKRKGNEIASVSQDWTNIDLQRKIQKDYTNYKPKEQL